MPVDMDLEARTLRTLLALRELKHLHVTKRGKTLTIASGPEHDPDPHHTGRWDKTPFVGDMEEMVDMAADLGRLDDFDPPGSWNQGATSDPSH